MLGNIYRKRKRIKRNNLSRIDDAVIIGGATGTQCGYIDFISWDLSLTLKAVIDIFKDKPSIEVCYQRYRKDMPWIYLKNEKETVIN